MRRASLLGLSLLLVACGEAEPAAPEEVQQTVIRGHVLNPDGAPVRGLPVTLFGPFLDDWCQAVDRTVTDFDGYYSFHGPSATTADGSVDRRFAVCAGTMVGELVPDYLQRAESKRPGYLVWVPVTLGEQPSRNMSVT